MVQTVTRKRQRNSTKSNPFENMKANYSGDKEKAITQACASYYDYSVKKLNDFPVAGLKRIYAEL